MNNNKKRAAELIDTMAKSASELTDLWAEHDELYILNSGYPFDKCFTEIAVDLNVWSINVSNEVNKV